MTPPLPLAWLEAAQQNLKTAQQSEAGSRKESEAIAQLTAGLNEIENDEDRLVFWRRILGSTEQDRKLAQTAEKHYFKIIDALPPTRGKEILTQDAEALDLRTNLGRKVHQALLAHKGPSMPLSPALTTRLKTLAP